MIGWLRRNDRRRVGDGQDRHRTGDRPDDVGDDDDVGTIVRGLRTGDGVAGVGRTENIRVTETPLIVQRRSAVGANRERCGHANGADLALWLGVDDGGDEIATAADGDGKIFDDWHVLALTGITQDNRANIRKRGVNAGIKNEAFGKAARSKDDVGEVVR